jgi:hypothetical protein
MSATDYNPYPLEKIEHAVRMLASLYVAPEKRLASAMGEFFLAVNGNALPESARRYVETIRRIMGERENGGEGRSWEAKARELTDTERSEISDAFVYLYGALAEDAAQRRGFEHFKGRVIPWRRP